jgi:hypothetical protein
VVLGAGGAPPASALLATSAAGCAGYAPVRARFVVPRVIAVARGGDLVRPARVVTLTGRVLGVAGDTVRMAATVALATVAILHVGRALARVYCHDGCGSSQSYECPNALDEDHR